MSKNFEVFLPTLFNVNWNKEIDLICTKFSLPYLVSFEPNIYNEENHGILAQ